MLVLQIRVPQKMVPDSDFVILAEDLTCFRASLSPEDSLHDKVAVA